MQASAFNLYGFTFGLGYIFLYTFPSEYILGYTKKLVNACFYICF